MTVEKGWFFVGSLSEAFGTPMDSSHNWSTYHRCSTGKWGRDRPASKLLGYVGKLQLDLSAISSIPSTHC